MTTNDELTDLEALCVYWKVAQEEAIRRSTHLCRELIEHQLDGVGEVILRKGRKRERLRFLLS